MVAFSVVLDEYCLGFLDSVSADEVSGAFWKQALVACQPVRFKYML